MTNEDYKKHIDTFRHSIFESFSIVRDPRVLKKSIRHQLIHIFFIALYGMLCGANTMKEIALYAKEKEEWFKTILELPHGVPSYSTFWWVFAICDPREFHEGFSRWIGYLMKATKGEVYAIDGKALRGTAIKGKPNSFVQIVSAWATTQQITLGQVKVNGKSNEITAIPKLLEMLDISGAIITIDAAGTQKEIAGQIVNSGGDYVLALKGNQGKLNDEIAGFFEPSSSK